MGLVRRPSAGTRRRARSAESGQNGTSEQIQSLLRRELPAMRKQHKREKENRSCKPTRAIWPAGVRAVRSEVWPSEEEIATGERYGAQPRRSCAGLTGAATHDLVGAAKSFRVRC